MNNANNNNATSSNNNSRSSRKASGESTYSKHSNLTASTSAGSCLRCGNTWYSIIRIFLAAKKSEEIKLKIFDILSILPLISHSFSSLDS